MSFIISMGMAVNLVQALLFVLFFVLVWFNGIGWREYPFGIVMGFAAIAIGAFIVKWARSEFGTKLMPMFKLCARRGIHIGRDLVVENLSSATRTRAAMEIEDHAGTTAGAKSGSTQESWEGLEEKADDRWIHSGVSGHILSCPLGMAPRLPLPQPHRT